MLLFQRLNQKVQGVTGDAASFSEARAEVLRTLVRKLNAPTLVER